MGAAYVGALFGGVSPEFSDPASMTGMQKKQRPAELVRPLIVQAMTPITVSIGMKAHQRDMLVHNITRA